MAGYGYGMSVSGSRKSIVASSISAPTSLPFGAATPTLYFSGLVMPNGWNGEPVSDFSHDSPWGWTGGLNYYISDSGANDFYWNNYGNNQWTFKGRVLYDFGEGFTMYQSRTVCTNTAPAGNIPLTGWVNEAGITGSLVISATP